MASFNVSLTEVKLPKEIVQFLDILHLANLHRILCYSHAKS